MAGLAATLNAPGTVDTLAAALGMRGADGAVTRLIGIAGTSLEIAVRAVIPSIAKIVGPAPDGSVRTVAGLAVDGVASVTALDSSYATRGPLGLLDGPDPYAVIVADSERENLVVARNNGGPTLYYARLGDAWLVASEPLALLEAGVPARANVDVVGRFISKGRCDETHQTFFAGITQVLPGEVVVLGREGSARTLTDPDRDLGEQRSTAEFSGPGRVGVLLAPGMAGAAVLGAALAQPDCPRPLSVHTVGFPNLDGPASHTPAVLVPIPYNTVRHAEHQLDPTTLDLDAFLRDMGEPVTDHALVLAWAIARTLDGSVDSLVDASRGNRACVARVDDRIQSRYGVSLRCPLREADAEGMVGDAQLMTVAGRGLLPPVIKYAVYDSAEPITAEEIVVALRDNVAAALAVPRPWRDETASVRGLRRLIAGERVDAYVLLRAYLVERWLALFDVSTEPAIQPSTVDDGPARAAEEVVVAGAVWTRRPVRTELFVTGDKVPGKVAWYVANAVNDLAIDPTYKTCLDEPWFVVVAAKIVAIGQGRAVPLWEIAPGPTARTLSRLARGRLPHLDEPWTMQIAVKDAGALRLAAVSAAAAVGLRRMADRLMPADVAALRSPRPGAQPPADSAVMRAPFRADEAAADIGDALRLALPPAAIDTLVGCAVVAADAQGCEVIGFSPGPHEAAVPRAESVVAHICADNPAGQGSDRTPVLLLLRRPAPRTRSRAERDPAGIDIKTPLRPAERDVVAQRRALKPHSDARSAASFSSTSARRLS